MKIDNKKNKKKFNSQILPLNKLKTNNLNVSDSPTAKKIKISLKLTTKAKNKYIALIQMPKSLKRYLFEQKEMNFKF